MHHDLNTLTTLMKEEMRPVEREVGHANMIN